jgi:ABC-2 type transport system permease protein
MIYKKMLTRSNWDLFVELTKTSFKLRYQNSVLGVLWVLIKPYSTFIVMYLVWTRVLNQSMPNYQLYLLIGIVIYTFTNELIITGQMALLERANIILKVNFPRQIAIISALTNSLINLAINMVLVFIIILLSGQTITFIGVLYFLFVALILFLFGLSLSFFTSVLSVRFRDLKNILELAVFLLYWATPILFTVSNSVIPGPFTQVIAANPLGILINQIRASFGIYGEIDLPLMLVYFVVSIICVLVGWAYFNVNVKKVSEYF